MDIEVLGKKTVGKYNNLVRLSVHIYAAQDEQLLQVSIKLGKSKNQLIREAVTVYLGIMAREGVL